MTPRERIDRILKGQDTDRPAFSFWYHFQDENEPPETHARNTLDFHRRLRTDLVKVMSDYPYPKPPSGPASLQEEADPFPRQVRALELIRDGLGGRAHFVETVFNPWNQAGKVFGKAELQRWKAEDPAGLLRALDIIARSEANHARRAIAAGASGVFLAIDNAQPDTLSREEYRKFSEPFDRMVVEAVRQAPLNILHLHGDRVYLAAFYRGWPAAAISYSTHATGVPIAEVRSRFDGVLMGGLDEVNFRSLTPEQMKEQWQAAQDQAGRRFLLAPGCSVPDETADEELLRLAQFPDEPGVGEALTRLVRAEAAPRLRFAVRRADRVDPSPPGGPERGGGHRRTVDQGRRQRQRLDQREGRPVPALPPLLGH